MDARGSFFAHLLDWIAVADRQGEPFRLWTNSSTIVEGWNVRANPVLNRRRLEDFGIESPDDVKGVNLFSIAVHPESRRQGRAIATIRYLLDNVQRADGLDYFAVTNVESEELRAGLKKYVSELTEAYEGSFFYFIKSEVNPLPKRGRVTPLRYGDPVELPNGGPLTFGP